MIKMRIISFIILSSIFASNLYGTTPEPVSSEVSPELNQVWDGLMSPFDLDNPSQETIRYYWILYKDYPYVENALITEEQLEALRYFENFGYDYITAKNTNRAIKFIEQYFVKMRLRK